MIMKKSFKQIFLSRALICSSTLLLTSSAVMQSLSGLSVNADTTTTDTISINNMAGTDNITATQIANNSTQENSKNTPQPNSTEETFEANNTAQTENEKVSDDGQTPSENLSSSANPTQLAVIVNIDETNFPDPILREWVKNNVAGGGDVLTDQMINSVTSINISNLGVEDLTGIQFFTKLTNLSAVNNNISYINPLWFPNLKTLYIMNNKLAYLPGTFNSSQNVPQYSSGEAIWNTQRQRWEYDPAQFQGLDKSRFSDTLYSGTTNHAWAWDSANQVMYRTDRQNFSTYDFIYGYKGDSGNVIGGYYAVVTFSGIVTAKYISQDGVCISPDVELSGYIGNDFSTDAKSISGYELVSTQGPTSGTFSTSDQNVTYTYTPKYESEIETKNIKRTIHYNHEDGTKAANDLIDVVTFNRTATKNLATGEVTYTDWLPKNNDVTFEAVTSPLVDNYTADKMSIDEVSGLTINSKDIEDTVTYSPKIEKTIETRNIKQVIHYIFEDGTQAADNATDVITFNRTATKNLATGEVTYSDWGAVDDDTTFEAVSSPKLKGFTADQKIIAEVIGLTADSKDYEIIVTYVKEKAVVIPITPSLPLPTSKPTQPSVLTAIEKKKTITTNTTKQNHKIATYSDTKFTKKFTYLPSTGDKTRTLGSLFGIGIIVVAIIGVLRLKRQSK